MSEYDINFLAGQLHAQRALWLALARLTTNRDDLFAECQAQLELLRTGLLSETVPERLLDGIDATESWLSSASGQS
jgi:hypothetical protein